MRGGEPLLGRQLWKLCIKQPAKDFGAFAEITRLRQFADITFDAREALRLDHRPDIVQHGAGDRGRMRHTEQHGEKAAARTADEHGLRRFRAR